MGRIKIMGLALVAVLVLGGIATSAADASKGALVLSTGAKEGALKAGEPIELSSMNLQFVTGIGTYDCTTQNSLSGTLTSNAGTKSDPLDITGFSGGSCKSGEGETAAQVIGLPWTVDLTPKGTAEVTSGAGAVGFAMYIGSLGATCHFEAKHIKGTFTPGTEEAAEPLKITWTAQTLKLAASDKAKCASLDPTVSGIWNLSLFNSQTAVMSFRANKIPCYIIHTCQPPLNLYYDPSGGVHEKLVPLLSVPLAAYVELYLEGKHGPEACIEDYFSGGWVYSNSEPTDGLAWAAPFVGRDRCGGSVVSGGYLMDIVPSSDGTVTVEVSGPLVITTPGQCVYELGNLTGTIEPPPAELYGAGLQGAVTLNKSKSLGTCKKDTVTGGFSVSWESLAPPYGGSLETEVP